MISSTTGFHTGLPPVTGAAARGPRSRPADSIAAHIRFSGRSIDRGEYLEIGPAEPAIRRRRHEKCGISPVNKGFLHFEAAWPDSAAGVGAQAVSITGGKAAASGAPFSSNIVASPDRASRSRCGMQPRRLGRRPSRGSERGRKK